MVILSRSKGGALSGKKAVGLILLIVGVLLMFFIISQGISIYKSSRESSDEQGLAGVKCVGYVYSIGKITSTSDELQFELRSEHSSTEDISNITVVDERGTSRTFDVAITPGVARSIRVPVAVQGNFSVYPDSCGIYPAICSIDGECTYH